MIKKNIQEGYGNEHEGALYYRDNGHVRKKMRDMKMQIRNIRRKMRTREHDDDDGHANSEAFPSGSQAACLAHESFLLLRHRRHLMKPKTS